MTSTPQSSLSLRRRGASGADSPCLSPDPGRRRANRGPTGEIPCRAPSAGRVRRGRATPPHAGVRRSSAQRLQEGETEQELEEEVGGAVGRVDAGRATGCEGG